MSDQSFESQNEPPSDNSSEPNDSRVLGPVPVWQIAELNRRAANLKEHPESVMTWEQIVQKLRARHRS
jgi:hypothetical protein